MAVIVGLDDQNTDYVLTYRTGKTVCIKQICEDKMYR